MAVNSGDNITAANYNTLQSRVNSVLGTGNGQNGYGQSLSSSSVSAQTTITAAHMTTLLNDINNVNGHIFGSNTTLSVITTGDTIGANASDGDTNAGFNAFLSRVEILEANQNLVDGTQSTVEPAITSSRTSEWNGTVTHTFTVTFNDANHRRYFFNTGGEVWLEANITGDATAKAQDWNTMFVNQGIIKFQKNATTNTGTGTSQAVGNYNVTTSYQKIFEKNGSAANYSENIYRIQAKEVSSAQLQFKIEFQDNDAGDPNFDENIGGTLTSTIKQKRATGSFVAVTSPAYANTSNL